MFQSVAEVLEGTWMEASWKFLAQDQVHALAMKTNHIISALERYSTSIIFPLWWSAPLFAYNCQRCHEDC